MTRTRLAILVIGPLTLLAATQVWVTRDRLNFSSDQLLLLLPDDVSVTDPYAMMWLDAAVEEGLHVVPVHDSEFIRPVLRRSLGAGVILPDTIHRRASEMFLLALEHYVSQGGKLLLTYDAGTFLTNRTYASRESRLSQMAGVSYALYDSLGEKTIKWATVKGSDSTFIELDVPPGKYYPFHNLVANGVVVSDQSVQFGSSLRRYKYGDLEYPSYVTSGAFDGHVLLRSDAGVVAGEHRYGRGSVLFVNLPLGYLQTKTDGLMLHGFLTYFAAHVVGVPHLLAVPDGIGGMILNWHVDSNAAIKPMQEMESWALMKQGPYSVHVTAGPDMMVPGDQRGIDVEHNVVSQDLLREYVSRGYTIGSHGGWIHNYFASHVAVDDPQTMQQYLVLNKAALEKVSNTPVLEYSAPDGNQPDWATQWLEEHGFIAYYFTGDSGMGPTREYQRGTYNRYPMWAFPILHLDRAAGFEELSAQNHPPEEVEQWLESLTAFVSNNHVARLLYFHPPGILPYHDVVEHWMQVTAHASLSHVFRWYTMTQLANFLNDRREVKWRTTEKDGLLTLEASHPRTIAHFAWQLPCARYTSPRILSGHAIVTEDHGTWIVAAQSDIKLTFETRELSQ